MKQGYSLQKTVPNRGQVTGFLSHMHKPQDHAGSGNNSGVYKEGKHGVSGYRWRATLPPLVSTVSKSKT